MKPTTLRERYEDKFASAYLVGDADAVDALLKDISNFFHKELMALADECEKLEKKGRLAEESIYDMAIDDAVIILRNRAAELNN